MCKHVYLKFKANNFEGGPSYGKKSTYSIKAALRMAFKAPAEKGTESWGGHSEKFKIFLLQKLNSYGEP